MFFLIWRNCPVKLLPLSILPSFNRIIQYLQLEDNVVLSRTPCRSHTLSGQGQILCIFFPEYLCLVLFEENKDFDRQYCKINDGKGGFLHSIARSFKFLSILNSTTSPLRFFCSLPPFYPLLLRQLLLPHSTSSKERPTISYYR